MKSRYATITGTQAQIAEFEERIISPIDDIIELVCRLMDMAPDPLLFNIELFESAGDVQDKFREFYDKDCDYIAFTSPSRNTIYLSIPDIRIRVFAHEVAHVVLNKMCPKLSVVCHEIIAQAVESKI